MPEVTIDGKKISPPHGTSVLTAATTLGIAIPTLCHMPDSPHLTSCMLCLVKDSRTGRLLPSCSMPTEEGMMLESDTPEVRDARRGSLELLLAEHVGDCEAPCRRACPAGMNIPLMIRQIAAGQFLDAVQTVKHDIALPAVLGRICPAPCEKACRRRHRDQPLSICLLKRFAADVDLARPSPWQPPPAPPSGRRVAIIGAGPAGLATAYYLARNGHACTVFDDQAQPGGALRTALPEHQLPASVLDAEIALIRNLGVEFRLSCHVGRDIPAGRLEIDFNAIVLATGDPGDPKNEAPTHLAAHLGLDSPNHRLVVNTETMQTSKPGIFACGSLVRAGHLAVRAVGQGKTAARAVHQFLTGDPVTGEPHRFNSLIGRLAETEIAEHMKGAADYPRVESAGGTAGGMTETEARREAARCMHCDCRKPDTCRLRILAGQLGAGQARFRIENRHPFERIGSHPSVIYEPGKCIKCGICVRICEESKEKLGLTFIGRGFQVRVGVPFSKPLSEGIAQTASKCIDACPTGALATP